ncbi:MAG TPA: TonB-dependent receptor [Vicinamibacterales bacterium]|nr:TonB-dependent receptor [Vicinamibacterales bacterium]
MRAAFRSVASQLLLAIVVMMAAASAVQAQTFQGGLRGTVKDANGVVPTVTVVLINEETKVSRQTVTNAAGEYSFPAVPPGTYTVRANITGFKTFEQKALRIDTQQFVTLDLALEVGTITETVTVQGESPTLETSNASHANVLDQKTLQTLPSVGRNVFLMAVTVPTVQSSGDTHWNRMQDQTGASTLSVGGGGVRANNYLLDGFPITDLQNRSSTNPSAEMVSDVRVQIHTYDSEMGRTGGGVFNTTAKSGTNRLHGSAFYLGRPNTLIGPNFFAEIRGDETNAQYWRNGGGGVGGPIVRNKTFFYFAGEVYRDAQAQNDNLHVPTAAIRTGDFRGLVDSQGRPIVIYDPLTTDAAGNRQPFQNNIIPPERINLVGRALAAALPQPTERLDTDNGNFNYPAQDTILSKATQTSIKIDHQFSGSVSLGGVYLRQSTFEPDANYFPDARYAADAFHLQRDVHVFVLNNTYVLNPSMVATFRAGMNTFSDDNVLPYEFDMRDVPGINQAFANAIPVQKFPALTLTGYEGTGSSGLSDTNYYSWGVNGSLSKLAGSHSFKLGADYRIIGVDSLANGQSAGSYTFNGRFTGSNANNPSATSQNAIADLLLGYPSSGSLTLATRYNNYIHYSGVFVQDDWRITDKLTVNYGVRLEHETGLAERDNKLVVGFDRDALSPLNVTIPADPVAGTPARQVTGGLMFARVNSAPSHVGKPPTVKASPRLGVAYRVSGRTVLRAGYGIFWAPWQSGVQSAAGYSQATSLQQDVLRPITSIDNPFPNGLTPISGNASGMLTGVSTDITFIDPDRDAPRVHQYSVDLQRELRSGLSVGVTYIGSTGQHLTWGGTGTGAVNINQVDPTFLPLGSALTQLVPNPFFGVPGAGAFATRATIQRNQLLRPYPQFLNVNMIYSTLARSQYHAGVVSVTKRATGWWGGRISYTYSRLYDNQFGQGNFYTSAPGLLDNYAAIPWSERFNPDAEWGRSRLDSPHKLVASPIFRLPFGEGRRWLNGPLADLIAGGWTVSLVVQMQSGFPLGVSQNANNTNLLGAGQRPNVVPGVDAQKPGSLTDRLRADYNDNQFLNPDAFTQAPAGTFGNAPRTLPGVYSPWRNTTDLAIDKTFPAGGVRRATLRVEVINLFDNPWYSALASTAHGNVNFGRVTQQANYSRTVQITARLSW